jgi:hypothetical protein
MFLGGSDAAGNFQNVIYNFNFPDESECINKEANKPEISQVVPAKAESKVDIRRFFNVLVRRETVPPPAPKPIFVPNSTDMSILSDLRKLAGPNMLVNVLRRYGVLLQSKINVPFKRTMLKDEIIQWYSANWSKIRPLLPEIKPDAFTS